MRRLWRIGTSERLSAPPAIPTSACPSRIDEATSAIAWLADAQARLTVCAGTDFGSPARRDTSRPRFGALTEGTTWPMTSVPIEAGSTSVRSRSSRTQAFPRSRAVRSRNAVPERTNGVRHPATIATLRLLMGLISPDAVDHDRRGIVEGTTRKC
jgi:hypothetical protein